MRKNNFINYYFNYIAFYSGLRQDCGFYSGLASFSCLVPMGGGGKSYASQKRKHRLNCWNYSMTFATSAYLKNGENNLVSTSTSSLSSNSIDTAINKNSIYSDSRKDIESLFFTSIKSILTEGFNDSTQKKIEMEVVNLTNSLGTDKEKLVLFFGSFDSSLLQNSVFKEFIFAKHDDILYGINKLKLNNIQKRRKKKGLDNLFSIIFTKLDLKDFFSVMIMSLFKSITFYNIHSKKEDNPYINSELELAIDIGEKVMDRFIWVLYKEKSENNFRYSQFKKSLYKNDEDFKILEDGRNLDNLYYKIGFKLLEILSSNCKGKR